MNDLRLAGDVVDAAQYISRHGQTDIEVLFADGSRVLYIKGEDVTPVWLSSPMPEMQPGRPPSHLDMTPTQIRLGRWQTEAEKFVASNSFSVEDFLDLYKSAFASGRR